MEIKKTTVTSVVKPNPKNMVKIGDLRKIVGNLKYRQNEIEQQLEGADEADVNTKPLFIERNTNSQKINKYGKLLSDFDKKNPPQDMISKALRYLKK